MTTAEKIPASSNRLVSLDFTRGLILVLLALKAQAYTSILQILQEIPSLIPSCRNFFRHPWNGLRFWDLIQPGFMFIAGTAMALSLEKQRQKGVSWNQSFKKSLEEKPAAFFLGSS